MKLWFRAKWFGWGWYPASWEGWLVTLVFMGLILGLAALFTMEYIGIFWYVGIIAVLVAILIKICYLKGEPPRWRWGIPKR